MLQKSRENYMMTTKASRSRGSEVKTPSLISRFSNFNLWICFFLLFNYNEYIRGQMGPMDWDFVRLVCSWRLRDAHNVPNYHVTLVLLVCASRTSQTACKSGRHMQPPHPPLPVAAQHCCCCLVDGWHDRLRTQSNGRAVWGGAPTERETDPFCFHGHDARTGLYLEY